MATLDALYSLLERMEASCQARNEREVAAAVGELVAASPEDVSSLKAVGLKLPAVLDAYPAMADRLYDLHMRCLGTEGAVREQCIQALQPVLAKNDELTRRYTDLVVREAHGPNREPMKALLRKLAAEEPLGIIEKYVGLFRAEVLKGTDERNNGLVGPYHLACDTAERALKREGCRGLVRLAELAENTITGMRADTDVGTIPALRRLLRSLVTLPSPTIREDIALILLRCIDSLDASKEGVSCSEIVASTKGNPVTLASKVIDKAKSIVGSVKSDKDFCWVLALAAGISFIGSRAYDRDAVTGAQYVLFSTIGRLIRGRATLGPVDMEGLFTLRKLVDDVAPTVLYREYGTLKAWNGWVLEVADAMFGTIKDSGAVTDDGFRYVSTLKSNDFKNILEVMVSCCRQAPLGDSGEQEPAERTLIAFAKSKLDLLARYITQFILPRKPDSILDAGKEEKAVEFDEQRYGTKSGFMAISRIILDLIGENPHLPLAKSERKAPSKPLDQRARREPARSEPPGNKRVPSGRRPDATR